MPGVLESILVKIEAIESTLAEVASAVRTSAHPVCPMLPEEEVWADGPLTVEEAAEFLRIGCTRVAALVRTGELVSMKDGRRLIAKRGCVRYLARHTEIRGNVSESYSEDVKPEPKKPDPKKGKQ